MKPVRPGELRHKLEVRRANTTQNAQGGYDGPWEPVAAVWGKVEGIDGHESMLAHALEGVSSYRITIRWRWGVRQSDQAVLGDGTALNIRSVSDPDGKRRWLTILADTDSVVRET